MVGFAGLIERDAPGLLEHGLTATRRTHRGAASRLRSSRTQVAWAAANGYELITFTQDRNEGMQAINRPQVRAAAGLDLDAEAP